MKHGSNMLQIFGGYRYIKNNTIERIFKDVEILHIFDGANDIQGGLFAQHLLELKAWR